MNSKETFVGYEYKNISVKSENASMYTDCLSNFGWELVNQKRAGLQPDIPKSPVDTAEFIPSGAHTEDTVGHEMVDLQFKRDRRINNKQKLDQLECKCEEALETIRKIENKNNAFTMGTSLGIGIIGTAFIGLSVYNFIFSNIALGIVLAAIGAVGCGIGFLANYNVGSKRAAQAKPEIQEQLNIAYTACEQAHALI